MANQLIKQFNCPVCQRPVDVPSSTRPYTDVIVCECSARLTAATQYVGGIDGDVHTWLTTDPPDSE